MLSGARVEAVVPVSDLDRAIEFYGQTLGLGTPERDEFPGTPGARFRSGASTLYLYKSVGAGQSRHTLVAFDVDDIDQAVASLRRNGVTFEEYDSPDIKTENGIATIGEERAAWFKDPDGNILGVAQTARVGATA
ncbi:MAG: VOC family protein [Thermoleophilia bacterium]|nr:VOC family protein [Thermoleophilia bacterium]